MKMMSKTDHIFCDCYLRSVVKKLRVCLVTMKGKYGTSGAVKDIRCAIKDVERALFCEPIFKEVNKFRTPPNTPKSRRLGWYEEGVNDEQ